MQVEDLFGGGDGGADAVNNSSIELTMPLFFPVRNSRGVSREEVIFELGLPSMNEIVK